MSVYFLVYLYLRYVYTKRDILSYYHLLAKARFTWFHRDSLIGLDYYIRQFN